jgi:hypothetical protein
MKSIVFILFALLFIASITIISARFNGGGGGDYQRMNHFFEYLNPAWRLHRARLRPFVYSNPDPVWRIQGK